MSSFLHTISPGYRINPYVQTSKTSCRNVLNGHFIVQDQPVWILSYIIDFNTSLSNQVEINIWIEPVSVVRNENITLPYNDINYGDVIVGVQSYPEVSSTSIISQLVSSLIIPNILNVVLLARYGLPPTDRVYDAKIALDTIRDSSVINAPGVSNMTNYNIQVDYVFGKQNETNVRMLVLIGSEARNDVWTTLRPMKMGRPVLYFLLQRSTLPGCEPDAKPEDKIYVQRSFLLPSTISVARRNVGVTGNNNTILPWPSKCPSPFYLSLNLDNVRDNYNRNPPDPPNNDKKPRQMINPPSTFRLEITFWDIRRENVQDYKNIVIAATNNDISVQNNLFDNLMFNLSNIIYYDVSDSILGVVKFDLELPSSVMNLNCSGPRCNADSLFIGVWNCPQSGISFEVGAYFVNDERLPPSVVIMPLTVWALVGLASCFCITTLVVMCTFSCKFYDKLINQRPTTFDKLSNNDPLCLLCSLWFSLLGEKASRRSKQLQIFIPALLIFIVGLTSGLVLGVWSYSSRFDVNCCVQSEDQGYRTSLAPTTTGKPPGPKNPLSPINLQDTILPNPIVNILNEVYILYTNSAIVTCFTRSSYITSSTSNNNTDVLYDSGSSDASILCFRNKYKKVNIRGNDALGVIGTLLGGLLVLIAMILMIVLLIEMFLSGWYFEKVLLPRVTYYILNE
ncbi:hypothetical protein AKO1_007649 [Acrasis kona]|uniref:Uncharacterized protein n=1 Tax=Acrasis kona TaxID=1008807 RepID=A0AAW2YQV5_9EUKA